LRDRAEIASIVYDVLATRWPGRFDGAPPADDDSLGKGGLGLDSIEIVELLLDCEERIGENTNLEALIDSESISVRRLIDHLAAA
jgi:acyl carrier protein